MTKVQVRFHLRKPLDESDYHGIAMAHAKYGIDKITVAPDLQALKVENDPTRLRPHPPPAPPRWSRPSPPPVAPSTGPRSRKRHRLECRFHATCSAPFRRAP